MAQSPGPRELRFTVNGMNFAAQEWGDSTQLPVLALHGWLDNAASFFALAPRLKNLHIVALDMAGHGQSEHRPGQMAYTPWDDINDILAVADHFGWERFVLLGHSRGAIIGTLAAGTFPERFIALGLVYYLSLRARRKPPNNWLALFRVCASNSEKVPLFILI
jgi:pimeloyl-ACP methyl ester carboxylesterase